MSPQNQLVREMITIDAVLADSVATPPDGKMYLQGAGWNFYQTAALPVRIPRTALGIFLHVPYALADNTPRKFEVTLLDADSKIVPLSEPPPDAPAGAVKVTKVTGQFVAGRLPVLVEPGDEQTLLLGVNIDGLVLQRAGTYKFRITCQDASREKNLRFRVIHLPSAGLAPGPQAG